MIRSLTSVYLLLILALCSLAPRSTEAAQSYDNCTGTIAALPAVISTQGTWCFTKDLNTAITSGNAITINTNNVTIDCNDFKLGGLVAGAGTTTIGMYSTDRLNTTVRHCNIRGFLRGIYFQSSGSGGGHAIEDNRFDNNTWVGMQIEGDGSVVRRNRVFDTGGSTGNADAYGIVTVDSVDVLDNTVSGVVARSGGNGSVAGIITNSNVGARISGNGVHGVVKDGTGTTKGILNISSDHLAIRDNDVVGDGSATSVGLSCATATSGARDNFISAFNTALSTCADSGGNTVIP
jgi:hypothetical protein